MKKNPYFSVVVPVFNAASMIAKCLEAIENSSYPGFEIIVVDDCSTDDTPLVAAETGGARVIRSQTRSGPAAARNTGAKEARGDILLFVDSDVLIRGDTLARLSARFSENPNVAAVFGSYDTQPEAKNFLSQYKNLVHHFVHQQSKSDAATFWAGCGAVRKDVFLEAGGFDQEKYARPCIEDIELGARLRGMGKRIVLDKDLQVKHLKEWRLKSLLATDIFRRAVPWTMLILHRKEMVNDLNLQTSQKVSAFLTGLLFLLFALSLRFPFLVFFGLIATGAIALINRKLIRFFLRERGPFFAAGAFSMQLLYYLYSGIVFVVLYASSKISGSLARREKYLRRILVKIKGA